MALFGPRLDRPSVIGDEGRPRAASLWVATLVVLGLTGVAGLATGQPDLLPSLGGVVGAVVAGVGLLDRERFVPLLVGHFLLFLFGSLLVGWLAVVTVLAPFGLAVVGLAVAMVGIGLAWANVGSSDAFQNVLVGLLVTYVTAFTTVAVVVVVLVVLLLGDVLVTATAAGISPAWGLTWFLLAVGYATGGLALALWRFPTEQLTARHRREERMARVRVALRAMLATTVLVVPAVVLVWILAALGAFDALASVAPPVALGLDALGTPWLLGLVVTVGTLALALTAALVLARSVTRRFETTTARLLGAAGGGVLVTVVLLSTVALLVLVPSISTLLYVLAVLVTFNLGPMVVLPLVVTGVVGAVVGLVPDRAGGPAVAAAGLVVAAIWFGRGPPWLVVALVAGAVVVWDLSAFGLGLTAELGHLPETRRLELFHAVVVLGVAVVAVLALTGLALLRPAVGGPGSTVATLVAGVGVLLLLVPLRG